MKQKLQKVYKKYYNETNLIISYLPIWYCSYYFNWNSFGVLISFLLEAFILLAFFVYLRSKAELKNQKQFKSRISYGNILYGAVPFFLFQYFIIAGTSMSIDNHNEFVTLSSIFSFGGLFTIGSLTFFYYKSMNKIKSDRDQRMAFYTSFLSKILVLSATSLLGLIVVSISQTNSLFFVLSFTIPARIAGEFITRKKFVKASF